MSRIYFHSLHGTAEVSGRERAWMGCLIHDIAMGCIGPPQYADWLLAAIPDGERFKQNPQMLSAYLGYGRCHLTFGDIAVSWWDVELSTVTVIGSEPLALVEGPNRAWLADLIDYGLEDGLFRKGEGWPAVTTLLRSRDDEPVVMSYSVCDRFPNIGLMPDDWPARRLNDMLQDEAYCALSESERWAYGMTRLRNLGDCELKPDHWPLFNAGETVFTLRQRAVTAS